MAQLILNVHPQLTRLLRPRHRNSPLRVALERRASIKDIIESVGIPHTEIGSIKTGQRQLDFGFRPMESGTIEVAPIKAPFDVTRPSRLRPQPLDRVCFVVDVNVGKLARWLRILGFDTVYSWNSDDADIAACAHKEKRIVLSKDTGLLKRNQVVFGRHIQSVQPMDQLAEVLLFFGLKIPFDTFSRCLRCNRELNGVSKRSILHRLEPKTKKYFQHFKICPQCRRIYWPGSHHEHMHQRLRRAGIILG